MILEGKQGRRAGKRMRLSSGMRRACSIRLVAVAILVTVPPLAGGIDVAVAQEDVQLWTCGMHPQVIQDKPGNCPICGMALTPLKVGDSAGDSFLLIDPHMVQNMGLRTAPVVEGALYTRVRAVGYLAEPESKQIDISLRVSGWIEKLYANVEGMHVEAGAPLFDLYSRELQVAVEELIAARRSHGGRGASDGPLGSLYVSAQRKLALMGLSHEQVERLAGAEHAPSSITFYSPISGHVTEKAVSAGSAVQAGDRVLRLNDRSTMWLDLQVYEQDLPLVRVGEEVTAAVGSLPGVRLQGEIAFVHPHLDPVSRTARARLVLDNRDGQLRQGMFASAEIRAKVAEQALMVPREAVIDTGTRQLTFVALGEGRFEPREVTMGVSGEANGETGWVQIVGGLAAGDKVVTSGQFLLDGESRMREAIRKHLRDKVSGQMRDGSGGAHDTHAH